MKIDSDEFRRSYEYRHRINSTPLRCFVVDGLPVSESEADEWELTGLNNWDYLRDRLFAMDDDTAIALPS